MDRFPVPEALENLVIEMKTETETAYRWIRVCHELLLQFIHEELRIVQAEWRWAQRDPWGDCGYTGAWAWSGLI